MSEKITTTDGDELVPSGLFAYYSCSDADLYLNITMFDLDQDGFMGIQCIGGVWDLDSIPTDANTTCISEPTCKKSDYQSQISAGGFKDPTEKMVQTGEFLFLTCQNSENFLYNSLDPLPAILPLFCNESSAKLEPFKLSPTWPTCSAPNYCPIGG